MTSGLDPLHTAHRAVELAARTSYGRLVAILSARTRDVAAAEDALGDAFAAALAQWPVDGVPEGREAWLLATARRRLLDQHRRSAVRESAAAELLHDASALYASVEGAGEPRPFPDRRLDLLFACAHPAIDAQLRTPLMLQVVLGLDAERIAAAFLSAPAAMAQRLVRGKRKLRDAGIGFEIPSHAELAPRLESVLESIYTAFGTGWGSVHGDDPARADLADEAIWLGRLVVDALPSEPEARGLLALMLYCHARRGARYDSSGSYVPLSKQDPASWRLDLVGEAESLLQWAARQQKPGRFQLEAAIQSVHLAPAFGRAADWPALASLYDALALCAPTLAVLVNRAAAHGEAYGAVAGLEACDALSSPVVRDYQPWWALRAHLLARHGRVDDAAAAYEMAAGLTADPAVRAFLLGRRESVLASP